MGLMEGPRLAAIGGTGWLGGGLVRAALHSGVISATRTTVTSRNQRRDGFEAFPALSFTSDNAEAAAEADIVLLAVRPQDLDAIKLDLPGKLVISVMALVPMAELHQRFGTERVIRAMPNAAAAQGLSYSPYLVSDGATEEDAAFANAFLAASGLAERVASEAMLDYLTGLTGSGPAFFATLASAMERDAVAWGLPPEMARRAITQLVKGAATALADAGTSMQSLVEVFLDYEGTTAAGIRAAEAHGLDGLVHAMLAAAESKARQKS